MKYLTLALVLVGACASALAADPVEEIAKRSGLPASEVTATLADCEANQTSMNFCAWRDQIVSEQKLELAVAAKAGSSAACEKALKKKIAVWKKRRDAECSRSASRQWGGGSMLPTAAATCKTAETDRMRETIAATECK
ncbi:lysozyme inhibitor LprI family protein [Paraburkholderia sp. MMS20-SJTR3]|uniref:Lysozyme inhibitor LprI family protein n=1 Tax=Paraburkholderia sejongensis TaxID=2886946 RepID=A0ABS8JWN9_9BURK|nr:lysozyme inhibitor LprI family protein [Paraburkholderia sp. MMS20-SJTR3]MCC8394294.1 lysozyme inhibitor LprI family protein [Paraburkholderia sp. MMS20-SJTR3]